MFLRDSLHTFSLALADLRFEWILSLCMVLALGAVFAPLFILLGLQEGIVGNMLDKLQSDPANRLVIPRFPTKAPLDTDWLNALNAQSALVISSPTSRLLLDIEGYNQRINAVPTTTQDPLLRENGIDLGEHSTPIVLSSRLAKIIGKNKGDDVGLVLERNTGKKERVTQNFHLAGILPDSITTDPKIWLPETIFRDVYHWRQGKALPSLGLSGRGYLIPEYDGIITILNKLPSDEEYRRILAGKLSFSQVPKPLQSPGWALSLYESIRLWRPLNNQVFSSDISPLINRHRELGYQLEAIPFVADFKVELNSEKQNKKLKLIILPSVLQPKSIEEKPEALPHVLVSPEEEGYISGAVGWISFVSGTTTKKKITVPVRVGKLPAISPGNIAFSTELAGKMNAARRQLASYDESAREFISEETTSHFFRAYAKSIDGIEALVEFVRKQGIEYGENALQEPISKLAQVRDLRKLAGYMEKLYLLIVLVAGVSGFFAIAANVYAGVERKRRDLACLQLLGLHRWALFLFPYIKSQFLVVGGLLVAVITYILFGLFADMAFSNALGSAESLTRLSWLHLSILVIVIFMTASLASLIAAAAVNRIEAGEIIHE